MEFKDRLRKLRKELNLTQKELGKNVNLAESTISHYENGIRMPDSTILEEFANLFKVSVDYLLCRTNNRKEIVSNSTLDEEISQIIKELGPEITLQLHNLKEMTEEEKENLKIFLQGLKARRNQMEKGNAES
ncbi:MAG: helix-turn-helix domain-containing protein [Dethiobacteria bacterium]|nr:XRE family transcriptional regulator [Bacillota bacterium]